jgi:hypothetical protein
VQSGGGELGSWPGPERRAKGASDHEGGSETKMRARATLFSILPEVITPIFNKPHCVCIYLFIGLSMFIYLY